MVFSSPIFLYLFLPLVLVLYYLSPAKLKNLLILCASLLFYTWGEDKLVLLMLASTLIDFFCGLLIDKGNRKIGLALSILTNLTLLGFFKYFNFTFENFNALLNLVGYQNDFFYSLPHIGLPIGISFYTFQTLSYSIDVYRGNVKASRNFINFATYVTMFPQLIAGPIVRYSDISRQIKYRSHSINGFSAGVERFILGLAKKVLIANTFASIADKVFSLEFSELSTVYAWIGIVSYAFQIYYDFSGYSDMAIGLGKMLGFDFMENFNYPYIATSIREFWRRWHISLSTWFRDYLYIPLGGNRVSRLRGYINLVIVFFITGLWHGASWNFIVWGMFHGSFIVVERAGFEKYLNMLWKPLQHIYTLLIILIGWVFFRAENLKSSILYLEKMFFYQETDPALISYLNFFYINTETILVALIAVVFSNPLKNYISHIKVFTRLALFRTLSIFMLLALSLIYLGANTYNPFIYFRF